jgi:hypothetical protein
MLPFIIAGLWLSASLGVTIYSVASDIIAIRREKRRAAVERPVLSLARMRVVRGGWRRA